MNSKSCICACCGDRLNARSRRPLIGKRIRFFVATRVFPTSLSTDEYICNKCRAMYSKWTALPEFHDLLSTIDSQEQTTATAIGNISDKNGKAAGRMDDENGTDQLTDNTPSEIDSMDADCPGVRTMSASSSDVVSVDDFAASDDQIEDEQVNPDEESEAVSSA